MDKSAVPLDHNVLVMPVLYLQEVAHQAITHQTSDEVGAFDLVVFDKL